MDKKQQTSSTRQSSSSLNILTSNAPISNANNVPSLGAQDRAFPLVVETNRIGDKLHDYTRSNNQGQPCIIDPIEHPDSPQQHPATPIPQFNRDQILQNHGAQDESNQIFCNHMESAPSNQEAASYQPMQPTQGAKRDANYGRIISHRYRVEQRIGSGAFGTIYKGKKNINC